MIGDSQFQEHGATALGWMTLQGKKSEGTDMHSRTAQILGISRDQAKIFNYGRIYGAGVKFASNLMRRFNPSADKEAIMERANELYKRTKGTRIINVNRNEEIFPGLGRQFWGGGSESFMFNALEKIATSENPRTPVLDCEISDALMPKFVRNQVFAL